MGRGAERGGPSRGPGGGGKKTPAGGAQGAGRRPTLGPGGGPGARRPGGPPARVGEQPRRRAVLDDALQRALVPGAALPVELRPLQPPPHAPAAAAGAALAEQRFQVAPAPRGQRVEMQMVLHYSYVYTLRTEALAGDFLASPYGDVKVYTFILLPASNISQGSSNPPWSVPPEVFRKANEHMIRH